MEERQRKRVWKPKVKTGCITCKVRRVKCDEGKPSCKRCTSTGRRCDGYEVASVASLSRVDRPSLPPRVSITIHRGTNKERESLDFFYSETAPEFAGFFNSAFWQQDLPLAATHHASLRNAIIGLGAMHRKFVDVRRHALPGNIADKQINFALEYCNRAIRDITKGQPVDIVMTMTFCVLFHCFAWLQGHLPLALNHLRGGLKILKEINDHQTEIPQSKSHSIAFNTMRTILVNLDMQVRAMMNQDQLPFWEPKPKSVPREVPAHFTSFDEARSYIEESFNEICSFLQLMDMGPKMELEISREEIKRLTEQYEKGDRLLSEFLSLDTTKLDEQQQKSLLILSMCRHQVDIFIQVYCEGQKKSEMVWDAAEDHFEQIVRNARLILEGKLSSSEGSNTGESVSPQSRTSTFDQLPTPVQSARSASIPIRGRKTERPIMTFSMGIVSSLWTVAFRCRDPNIRRDAIQLLVDHPRREGFWDGTMAAKIARRVLKMEEKACKDDPTITNNDPEWQVLQAEDIPDRYRVANVAINYTGLRSANIRYTTMTDIRRKAVGVVKPLTW